MDYAKNFKTKDIITRAAAFVLYFFTAGLTGTLCAMLAAPVFELALKQYPGAQNIILYIISAAAAFAALSFFSRREGRNDTEQLKFNRRRNFLAHLISGLVFCLLAPFILSNGAVSNYFFTPYFFPAEIKNIIDNYIFFPGTAVLYNAAEYIKNILALEFAGLYIFIFICVISGAGCYKSGRNKWIAAKKTKIKNYK